MANEGYTVRFKKSAAKELRGLDIDLQLRISEAIAIINRLYYFIVGVWFPNPGAKRVWRPNPYKTFSQII